MLKRRVRRSRDDVVEHGVPVREGPSLGVLAGEPNRNPLDEQRRERKRLRLSPVDPTLLERLTPPLELTHELRMRREPLANAEELLVEAAQPVGGYRRYDCLAGRGGEVRVVA